MTVGDGVDGQRGRAVIYHGMLFTNPISRLRLVLSPGVFSVYIQVPSSRRRARLMNMNSPWQPQRSPFLPVFINTSAPIDGRTVAVDKSCIYCTNTALTSSTLTHSSVCVRTEGDPFQLLCVGVCQQCSRRQSSLWRPVFRIDTGPRSACSQGPTWGLMNNGERILRAKVAHKSDWAHYKPQCQLQMSAGKTGVSACWQWTLTQPSAVNDLTQWESSKGIRA